MTAKTPAIPEPRRSFLRALAAAPFAVAPIVVGSRLAIATQETAIPRCNHEEVLTRWKKTHCSDWWHGEPCRHDPPCANTGSGR